MNFSEPDDTSIKVLYAALYAMIHGDDYLVDKLTDDDWTAAESMLSLAGDEAKARKVFK